MASSKATPAPADPAAPARIPPSHLLLSTEQMDKIIAALTDRKATQDCPRCQNDKFSIAPGLIYVALQAPNRSMVIGGPSIPCIAVTCARCGYLAQHALGALGFLGANGELTI